MRVRTMKKVEILLNGLITIYDTDCRWTDTYNVDGTPRRVNGLNPLSKFEVLELAKTATYQRVG
jgi:hypothetical protein